MTIQHASAARRISGDASVIDAYRPDAAPVWLRAAFVLLPADGVAVLAGLFIDRWRLGDHRVIIERVNRESVAQVPVGAVG